MERHTNRRLETYLQTNQMHSTQFYLISNRSSRRFTQCKSYSTLIPVFIPRFDKSLFQHGADIYNIYKYIYSILTHENLAERYTLYKSQVESADEIE